MTSSEPITNFSGYYRFLSNFYRHPVRYHGFTYQTAEHAYQAQKPVFEADRLEVIAARTPAECKRVANACVLRTDWHEIKLGVMEEVCRAKFEDTLTRGLLMSTGGRKLIEGNTWNDTFWGVCRGVGSNHLGLILMKIRDGS